MRYRQIALIGVSVLVVGVLIYSYIATMGKKDVPLANYIEVEKQIMNDMMKNMKEVPETGDVAINFLHGMIPHHTAAIQMSEALLEYGGSNEEIKKIAEDVIKVQSVENEQMKELILELEKNPQIDEDKEKEYLKEYNKMFYGGMASHGGMGGHGPKQTSVDHAFAEGMIMHHEMAIDMAESVLKYTDNETVKEMAETIIEVQQEEIAVMQSIMEKMK